MNMTKREIAEKLKDFRRRSNLTGAKVIELLKSRGMKYTVKALYNWEAGRSQPDCVTFLCLCDIYGVEDIMEAFGYGRSASPANSSLSNSHKVLEEKIGRLDEITCRIITAYIDGLLTERGEK